MNTKVYERLVMAKVERETEKAILADLTIDTFAGRKGRKVWMPKSCVLIESEQIWVVAWMLSKKDQELRSEMPGGYYGIITDGKKEVAA